MTEDSPLPPDPFYGTRGSRSAKIMVVGESWGAQERQKQKPFVGKSGEELDKILFESGIDPAECFFTNVVPAQPSANDMWRFFYPRNERPAGQYRYRGLDPMPIVQQGLSNLDQQVRAVRPEVIVGLGNWTLWAFTEDAFTIPAQYAKTGGRRVPRGIGRWRGSQLYTDIDLSRQPIPFMPTYHPASIFRQWPNRYDIVHDLKSRLPKALRDGGKEWREPRYNFLVRPSFEDTMLRLEFFLHTLDEGEISVAIDLETRYHFISCIGFGFNKLDALCIPFQCIENDEGYWSIAEELALILKLRQVLLHPNIRIRGQNYLYDMQYTWREWGVDTPPDIDTMVWHHLCWPGRRRGLDYISSIYNDFHRYWKDEGKEWTRGLPEDEHWVYNCRDCVATYEAADELTIVVEKLGLTHLLDERRKTIRMLFNMMRRGVLVDKQAKGQLAFDLADTFAQLGIQLDSFLSEDVYPRKPKASPWYTSPKQQCEIFYDILGIKEVKGGISGRTVGDEALEVIARREPVIAPIIQRLQDLRSIRQYKTHFVDAAVDEDGRMRTSYDLTGTKTFRFNSSENAFGKGSNLQNIPAGNEED